MHRKFDRVGNNNSGHICRGVAYDTVYILDYFISHDIVHVYACMHTVKNINTISTQFGYTLYAHALLTVSCLFALYCIHALSLML